MKKYFSNIGLQRIQRRLFTIKQVRAKTDLTEPNPFKTNPEKVAKQEPLEQLLGALNSCEISSISYWANRHGVSLIQCEIETMGIYDDAALNKMKTENIKDEHIKKHSKDWKETPDLGERHIKNGERESDAMGNLGDKLKETVSRQGMGSGSGSGKDSSFTDTLKDGMHKVQDKIPSMGEIKDTVSQGARKVMEKMPSMDDVKDTASQRAKKVMEKMPSMDDMKDTANQGAKKVMDKMPSMDDIKDTAANLGEKVSDTLKEGYNKVKDTISGEHSRDSSAFSSQQTSTEKEFSQYSPGKQSPSDIGDKSSSNYPSSKDVNTDNSEFPQKAKTKDFADIGQPDNLSNFGSASHHTAKTSFGQDLNRHASGAKIFANDTEPEQRQYQDGPTKGRQEKFSYEGLKGDYGSGKTHNMSDKVRDSAYETPTEKKNANCDPTLGKNATSKPNYQDIIKEQSTKARADSDYMKSEELKRNWGNVGVNHSKKDDLNQTKKDELNQTKKDDFDEFDLYEKDGITYKIARGALKAGESIKKEGEIFSNVAQELGKTIRETFKHHDKDSSKQTQHHHGEEHHSVYENPEIRKAVDAGENFLFDGLEGNTQKDEPRPVQKAESRPVKHHDLYEENPILKEAVEQGENFLFDGIEGRNGTIGESKVKNTFSKNGIVYEGFSFDPVTNTYKEIQMEIRVKTNDDKQKVKEVIEKGSDECPIHNSLKRAGIRIQRKIHFI